MAIDLCNVEAGNEAENLYIILQTEGKEGQRKKKEKG